MVRSGRSVSLESELWVRLEKFSKKKNLKDVSSTIEYMIKKNLEEEDK
jgi:macrodomain Ter protein organizer (MatP/YcbG family)